MQATVLVTGATGFLALHVVSQLLQKGYSVIGSVRSQAKADKLAKLFGDKFGPKADKLSFTIVEDISDITAFEHVFTEHPEIQYVLHTASPFTMGHSDFEKSYLVPAVNGTLGVLKAAHSHGSNVSKVVVTASFATIMNFDKLQDSSFMHDESVWNPLTREEITNDMLAYCLSKTLAERAAWDYIKNNDVKFSLNVINPPYIYGPQVFDQDAAGKTLNESNNIFKRLVHSDPEDTHLFNENVLLAIDVRDVAAFHIIPLERPGVEGHRLFPTVGHFSDQQLLNIINEKFPQLRGNIARGQPEGAATIPTCGYSNAKTLEIIGGYDFIPLEKQVIDTVQQILEAEEKYGYN
jgi:NADPH-dependent methylglyoxal reductase